MEKRKSHTVNWNIDFRTKYTLKNNEIRTNSL